MVARAAREAQVEVPGGVLEVGAAGVGLGRRSQPGRHLGHLRPGEHAEQVDEVRALHRQLSGADLRRDAQRLPEPLGRAALACLRDAAAYKTFYGDTHPHPQYLTDGS